MAFTYSKTVPLSDKDWVRRRTLATSDQDPVIADNVDDETIISLLAEYDRVETAAQVAWTLYLAYAREMSSFGEAGGIRFSYKDRAYAYKLLAEEIRAQGEAWETGSTSGGMAGEMTAGQKAVDLWSDYMVHPYPRAR
jgi:hypothetical protein